MVDQQDSDEAIDGKDGTLPRARPSLRNGGYVRLIVYELLSLLVVKAVSEYTTVGRTKTSDRVHHEPLTDRKWRIKRSLWTKSWRIFCSSVQFGDSKRCDYISVPGGASV